MTTTLSTIELRLLYACERDYKLPAAPIIHQLDEWAGRSLPDVIPVSPAWTTFQWPVSGEVNLESYWRGVDRQRSVWEREKL